MPTKVRLVKAMVFPMVMYGYESWTRKKAERRRIDAFKILSLCLVFVNLISMCLGMFLLGFSLYGTLCASST